MFRASGCARICLRNSSKSVNRATALGLAIAEILRQVSQCDANVGLLVIDTIETERFEKAYDFFGLALPNDDIAADVQDHLPQSNVVEALTEIVAPVFSLSVQRGHEHSM